MREKHGKTAENPVKNKEETENGAVLREGGEKAPQDSSEHKTGILSARGSLPFLCSVNAEKR